LDVCVGRKEARVVDFGEDPLLDEVDVLRGRDFDWIFGFVKPCVSVAEDIRGESDRGEEQDVPASGHCRTCLWVADGQVRVGIYFLDDLDHAIKKAVLFDD